MDQNYCTWRANTSVLRHQNWLIPEMTDSRSLQPRTLPDAPWCSCRKFCFVPENHLPALLSCESTCDILPSAVILLSGHGSHWAHCLNSLFLSCWASSPWHQQGHALRLLGLEVEADKTADSHRASSLSNFHGWQILGWFLLTFTEGIKISSLK